MSKNPDFEKDTVISAVKKPKMWLFLGKFEGSKSLCNPPAYRQEDCESERFFIKYPDGV